MKVKQEFTFLSAPVGMSFEFYSVLTVVYCFEDHADVVLFLIACTASSCGIRLHKYPFDEENPSTCHAREIHSTGPSSAQVPAVKITVCP